MVDLCEKQEKMRKIEQNLYFNLNLKVALTLMPHILLDWEVRTNPRNLCGLVCRKKIAYNTISESM